MVAVVEAVQRVAGKDFGKQVVEVVDKIAAVELEVVGRSAVGVGIPVVVAAVGIFAVAAVAVDRVVAVVAADRTPAAVVVEVVGIVEVVVLEAVLAVGFGV